MKILIHFMILTILWGFCFSEKQAPISLIEQPLLLVSTLNGHLYALNKKTGEVMWSLKEEPLVKLPTISSISSNLTLNFKDPLLLPDPKDGSLYLYNGIYLNQSDTNQKNQKDILEKMPFSINELVSSSPCRSKDGLLYTGKKTDSWILIDAKTGRKIDILNADSPICPREELFQSDKKDTDKVAKEDIIMLGKSKFHLNIFDLKSRRKQWNLTVVDYSASAAITIPQNNYDMLHLASASSGKLLTVDVETRQPLWEVHLSSPVISMYSFKLNYLGKIIKIPFSTVGTKGGEKDNGLDDKEDLIDFRQMDKIYFRSLYIGKSNDLKTLYTISSFVDAEKPLISNKPRRAVFPLIEGPNTQSKDNSHSENTSEENAKSDKKTTARNTADYLNLLLYGFYEFPDVTKSWIQPQFELNQLPKNNLLNYVKEEKRISENVEYKEPQIMGTNFFLLDNNLIINTQFLSDIAISIVTLIVIISSTIFIIYITKKSNIAVHVNNNEVKVTQNIVELSSGTWKAVGKISFDQNQIIGRGSSGTCIYKGLYENRQEIAVKRVISELFIVTDREIELLSKLHHPNLVRYFVTEFDDLFRYIAIELAEFSLADFVEHLALKSLSEEQQQERASRKKIEINMDEFDNVQILYESCLGLAHLHSLNIIHRDIKPQNILLTTPQSPFGKRKVLITDFGVSKVISDTHSLSVDQICTKNVISGTEGWIAPEVIRNKMARYKQANPTIPEEEENNANSDNVKSETKNASEIIIDNSHLKSKAIDIFSLGCVFYYVLSGGKHPFGDHISRQSNILKDESDLSELEDEEKLIHFNLIEKMISNDPNNRPLIESVLKHPFFWRENQQLNFFLCVSDRIEKEPPESDIVRSLEKNNLDVVRGDWKRHFSIELQTDLKKFRSYKSTSVKDLLRALRNKRHHYRELDEDLQKSLGAIPDEFVRYFTSRFPRLLVHSYVSMQDYRNENIFHEFYDHNCEWHFSFNLLPRSGIRWFDQIHKKRGPQFSNNLVLAPRGVLPVTPPPGFENLKPEIQNSFMRKPV